MTSALEAGVEVERAALVLERSAAFFEGVLWDSEIGAGARARLTRHGIADAALREFRVGYAPGSTQQVLAHLREQGFSDRELIAAGIASHSDRERLHVLFHARIMFPIGDAAGRVLGFAGLATHLGPSWPLWLTSPDSDAFRTSATIFAIGEAAPAIRRAGRALILRDPIHVLALHQGGREETVAVIHSPITRGHLAQLAAILGVGRGDLHLARRDGRLGVAVVPRGADVDEAAFAERSLPAGFSLVTSSSRSDRAARPAPAAAAELAESLPPVRVSVYVAGVLIGVGIPIGALLLAGPQADTARGPTPAFSFVIVGVAAAYAVLALIVAVISARVRAQSTARRMRLPWVRGRDEVQPAGWTYHRVEEILVGAALVSAVICVVLLMTIGGFLG